MTSYFLVLLLSIKNQVVLIVCHYILFTNAPRHQLQPIANSTESKLVTKTSSQLPQPASARDEDLFSRWRQLCAAQSAASARDATTRRRRPLWPKTKAPTTSARGTRAPLRPKTKSPAASARRTRALLRPMACEANLPPTAPTPREACSSSFAKWRLPIHLCSLGLASKLYHLHQLPTSGSVSCIYKWWKKCRAMIVKGICNHKKKLDQGRYLQPCVVLL